MWLLRVRAESRMAPCSSSPIKWNGTWSSSMRFSQVTSGRRTRPDGRGARPRIWASHRIDGPEGEQTTMIAEAMGGGQSEDEVARLSGAERDSPQPSPRGHVVIFLPALNEERAIGKVLDRIPRAQLEAAGSTVALWVGRVAEGAMTPLNAIGNRILSALARLLFGVSVTDVCTGMWGFKADALRRIPLEASGFDLEADLFGSACLSQARITELPIDYDARIGPAKMLPLRSGLQIALRLFVRRLNGPARPISRSRTEAPPGKQTAGLSRPEGMV